MTKSVSPGEETWAQIRLENPLALVKGDYFVIRSSDATLGGGTVVDPYAKRHRRHHLPTLERLEVMELGTQDEMLVQVLQSSESCSLQILADRANLSMEETRGLVEQLERQYEDRVRRLEEGRDEEDPELSPEVQDFLDQLGDQFSQN